MGRTHRRRRKRNQVQHLDHLPDLINLRKWMSTKGWRNDSNLKLANFAVTERGVMSSKNIRRNDTLITIPLDLMITYRTLQTSLQGVISLSSGPLEIHDLLTIFLVTETLKEKSLWREYINSLPPDPPPLPWLGTSEELNLYPADLQIISRKKRENLKESMYRARRSIKKAPDCVLDENLFKWGYVLVNTRAVYVQPDFVRNTSDPLDAVLADEPKMALCPFLDMFNHHFSAANESEIVRKDGRWCYQLRTLTNTRRYDEIFISYGLHDNVKLLMEYGFFLPRNIMDVVTYDLQEVLKVLRINLSERQYRFVKDHKFDKVDDLYVGYDGVSFNLKAVLFIGFNEEIRNYNSVVFGNYPAYFLEDLPKWIEELLVHTLEIFKKDYQKLVQCKHDKSKNALLLEDFLCYRTVLVRDLIGRLCPPKALEDT